MKNIFKTPRQALSGFLEKTLREFGYEEVKAVPERFIYAKGTIPVLLVAHMDTVHPEPPTDIFFDREKGVLWSPQGLGADDRAGVLAILHILLQNYRPHVLFCDLEETGGIGAREATKQITPPEAAFILELDRRGASEYVMYGWSSPELSSLLEGHGFQQGHGTFSDIAALCPAWGIPGANLSIGYYLEHSYREYLRIHETLNTAKRVCSILENVLTSPNSIYSYVADKAIEPEPGLWGEDYYENYYDGFDDIPPPGYLTRRNGIISRRYKTKP